MTAAMTQDSSPTLAPGQACRGLRCPHAPPAATGASVLMPGFEGAGWTQVGIASEESPLSSYSSSPQFRDEGHLPLWLVPSGTWPPPFLPTTLPESWSLWQGPDWRWLWALGPVCVDRSGVSGLRLCGPVAVTYL